MKFNTCAILVLSLVSLVASLPNESEEKQIQQILTTQAKCWNDKDIDSFMQTYWKSENLTFSGGGNTTRGWQATLDRYKKSYPKDKMGQLTFDGLEISILSKEVALVLGNWHLAMPSEDGGSEKKEGNFSLVLKKLDGHWKIIHDHSSTKEEKE